MRDLESLIDNLADEAVTVRPITTGKGRLLLGLVGATATVTFLGLYGIRQDVAQLSPPPLIAISLGLFAIMALAAGSSAVRMARPQVGAGQSGAPWALATLLLLPMAAMLALVAHPELSAGLDPHSGMRCMRYGLLTGSATLAFLGWWLRRGAPVSPERSAWYAGLAAGAVGAFANSLECPIDPITHIGVWHVGEVLAGGLIGRLVLPPLLRW